MYPVSTEWVRANESFLAPEGLVEISCYIPELRQTLVYTKKDLMNFTHQQTGSLVAGELPKNHIEFSLDNTDGKWNPSNPQGLAKYLVERLQIVLRYGFVIDGVERWIPGGTFYLSEWRAPQNGLEASFVARDILEYLIDRPYTGKVEGTLYNVVQSVLAEANIPRGEAILGKMVLGETPMGVVNISEELKKYSVGNVKYDGSETMAVILQKCANAAGCVMYQDRDGRLTIKKLSYEDTGYTISQEFSYAHPEIEISRPIKSVSVTYCGDTTRTWQFCDSGETQTLNNNFIKTGEQSRKIAGWVRDSLISRKQLKGEFRGDPRFDLFDVVSVESKYGRVSYVVLTDVKITFTGAFRVTYSGYVRGDSSLGIAYSGEIYTGEVV